MADPDLARIRVALREFVGEREWEQFHDAKNLSMLLASEAGEILALFRWAASGDLERLVAEPAFRSKLSDEIADVAIALLLLSDRTGIDLVAAVEAKIESNRAHYPVQLSKGIADRRKKT